MFSKPKFCCNCGEKVERTDWRVWSSWRFCEVCEKEDKLRNYLPRAAGMVLLLAGLFALGTGFQKADKPLALSRPTANPIRYDRPPAQEANSNIARGSAEPAQKSLENTLQAMEPQKKEDEPVYFCGARTKKGEPCTRRVKGGGRCWQHKGMAAMHTKDDAPKSSADSKTPAG